MLESENALVIFTKNPVKGKIKTRLAKDIGEQMALKVYMQLLKHTREITQDLDFCTKMIFYDDFIPAKDKWSEEHYDKHLQSSGSLSEKLTNAFEQVFEEGYERVVMMSPDCPELTGARVKQAFTLLKAKDFVIGPLTDGGYYIIGMNEFHPEVFDGMKFGHDQVWEKTVERIEEMGASYRLLEETFDVDYADDITPKLKKAVGLVETTADVDDDDIEEVEPDEKDKEDD